MTSYKAQLVQKLKPIDHPMRFRFAMWSCERFTEGAYFDKKKVIFSDDAHFDFGGPAIDLQKIPILAEKKSSFQMKLILILTGM